MTISPAWLLYELEVSSDVFALGENRANRPEGQDGPWLVYRIYS